MSAEFRLSREQRDGLRHANSIGALFPEIERIVASEVEAAERALVERLEAVLDDNLAAAFPEHELAVRIRDALTRPDAEGDVSTH